MKGPDGIDNGCISFEHLDNLEEKSNQVDITSIKVYYLDGINSFKISKLDDELHTALHNVVSHLSNTCEVINLKDTENFKTLSNAVDIWSCMLHAGNPVTFTSLMADGNPKFSAFKELIKWLIVGVTPYTLPGLGLCLIENVPAWFPKRTSALINQGEQLREELEALLGDNSVILFPSHPKIAPKHSKPLLAPMNWIYTGIWNVLLAPVTQVPLGLSKKDNLPLGIQVISSNGQDHLTLAVGKHLESTFGGWIPPHTLHK